MQCSVYAYNLYNYENYTIFIHDFKAFLFRSSASCIWKVFKGYNPYSRFS
ncbi:hypothetical protein AtDm6_1996 [Acetobacter tropicalis]|uniref:Uncharacterized protein n=1 Tax=Acetobacter tropicalis TaxID=104102 RepID=A0A094ZK25_9PROT|nr:hypothetical protein AtDm6_1996 [Acetobacter tropicalis]